MLDCTFSLGLKKATLEAWVFDAFWELKYMVFGCFAGAPGRGFRCLTALFRSSESDVRDILFRSSESDVRGWVFDAFWDLKYIVFGCFAGARGRGFRCLTVHSL